MQMLSIPSTFNLSSFQGSGSGSSFSENSSNDFATPQIPDWLSTDYNKQVSELIDSYKGIKSAYDPTEQVKAREQSAQNTLALGNAAANSAANEFTNRALLSGGSALGAGAMRAQLLFQSQNQANALKGEASDIAAESRQKANQAALQSSAALGQIRNNYLGTLASYYANLQNQMTQQRGQDMQFQLSQQELDAKAPKKLQLFYNGRPIPWGDTSGLDRNLLSQRYVNI